MGPLLRLVSEEQAVLEGATVLVPHASIAGLHDSELRSLGLPPRAALFLAIEAKGTLTSSDFRLLVTLRHIDGRPVSFYERIGAELRMGSTVRTLDAALFSALEAIDGFNASPPTDLDSRMLAWAAIKELLPEGATDKYLTEFRVASAPSFTLRPFRNEQGEPDFDPVPCQIETIEGLDSVEHEAREVLPPGMQKEFAASYRRRTQVPTRYAVGGGWFLVLPPQVKKALEVARRAQAGSVAERTAFLKNPRAFVREALGDELNEEQLEGLFWDEGFSDRVKAVGLWQPKVVPWYSQSASQWMPPEHVGLRIGDVELRLEPTEVRALAADLEGAIALGTESIRVEEVDVPATTDSLAAVRQLVDVLDRYPSVEVVHEAEPQEALPTVDEEKPAKLALLVKDNLEEVEYRPTVRRMAAPKVRRPGNLATSLLQHQVEGLEWLQDHWIAGHPGALLADDMGLGKTLTALSFLAWLRERQDEGVVGRKPLLVVAPTGLLRNWRDEHDRHLLRPGLGILCEGFGAGLSGLRTTKGTGGDLAGGLPTLDVSRFQNADWVLTTFETLRDYQHSFGRVSWGCVVLDEAQKIKNPAAGVTDAVKAMKTDFLIAMTGTPVENRLADLWSIVDTAWAGRLGSLKDFLGTYENEATEERLEELQVALTEKPPPPLMKRRMKEDHLHGLPERSLHVRRIPMPEVQATEYAKALEYARGSQKKGGMLEALHALRRISLHPFADASTSDGAWIDASARVHGCVEILDGVFERGEKALVFLEFLEEQGILAELLQRRYRLTSPPMVINGGVAGDKRKSRVDEFQRRSGFDVMLLSPKAGGVGLTLTAANHVIHLSRWWNPAVEDQCNDRIYRIGQNRPVHVHHVLAIHPRYQDHSFDVTLHNLLERKRLLSRSVLAPPAATDADASDLFDATVNAGR
ncbi:DEAD/DEAH box helicase [Vulgatibacter incomptus]|uniref:Helicase, SNF2/RAD54 family n=1 Tax=Vulgatibacter incomptus TaxID=1391653 RepID=A0A0K1PGI2_9BACT|nr:DEAD/DEAH box helicase [Vulgatibacter incomptus]AKU92630.1 Helicase, SNF2/RAD54 family [Vulgatibacter incomptus]